MAQKTIMESSLMLAVIRDWANGKFLTSADVVSAYKASGSKQASELTSDLLVAGNVGNVYNLSTALTITAANKSLFVENAEGTYPVGTNVVVVNVGTSGSPSYKFDILAGFVDTSSFLTAADVVNGGNTASWGSSVTIGTVGGVSLTFTMPANPNTHYTATPVLGATSATTNATSDTANDATFLNIVENSAKSGGIQVEGAGTVSVSAKNGKLTINGTDTNTHYTAVPVLGGQNATSNATTDTTDPYLNIIENGAKSGGVQIAGSGATSVKAKDGKVTISSSDTHYTAVPVAGGSSATTNATTNTADPYVNIVENSAKSGGIQLKGGYNISVTANSGVITFEENFSWMTQAQAEAILNASA